MDIDKEENLKNEATELYKRSKNLKELNPKRSSELEKQATSKFRQYKQLEKRRKQLERQSQMRKNLENMSRDVNGIPRQSKFEEDIDKDLEEEYNQLLQEHKQEENKENKEDEDDPFAKDILQGDKFYDESEAEDDNRSTESMRPSFSESQFVPPPSPPPPPLNLEKLGFTETLTSLKKKSTTKKNLNKNICSNIFMNGLNVNTEFFYPSEFPNLTKIKSLPIMNKKGGKKSRKKTRKNRYKRIKSKNKN